MCNVLDVNEFCEDSSFSVLVRDRIFFTKYTKPNVLTINCDRLVEFWLVKVNDANCDVIAPSTNEVAFHVGPAFTYPS